MEEKIKEQEINEFCWNCDHWKIMYNVKHNGKWIKDVATCTIKKNINNIQEPEGWCESYFNNRKVKNG